MAATLSTIFLFAIHLLGSVINISNMALSSEAGVPSLDKKLYNKCAPELIVDQWERAVQPGAHSLSTLAPTFSACLTLTLILVGPWKVPESGFEAAVLKAFLGFNLGPCF